jgi:hypothetical protein
MRLEPLPLPLERVPRPQITPPEDEGSNTYSSHNSIVKDWEVDNTPYSADASEDKAPWVTFTEEVVEAAAAGGNTIPRELLSHPTGTPPVDGFEMARVPPASAVDESATDEGSASESPSSNR